MTRSVAKGVGFLFRGIFLIQKKGVRKYVFVPLAINAVLFSLLIWFGASRFNLFIEWLLPTWLEWLAWLLWPLFAVGVLILIFYSFVLVCNLVAAPFNALLSEAVEYHLNGIPLPNEGGVKAMIMNFFPAFVSEGKKNIYFLSRAIPLLVLFIIPGVNVVAPFLWIVFCAWSLGQEYVDYPMGNHGLLFSEQRIRVRQRRWMVLGFGGATLVLLMIPFINFIVMPAAVAGATIMWVEEFQGDGF